VREAVERHDSQAPEHGVVIIPTYNERENLDRLVREILRTQPDLDVLVVDDNSPDGTGDIADALAMLEPRVAVVHRRRKDGLASAYLAGFRQALAGSYDYVAQMDADFSHRIEDLPNLIAALERADVAIGSRNIAGGCTVARSPVRRLVSAVGSAYARLLLDLPVRDSTGGFKCFRRQALLDVQLDGVRSRGYAFQLEMNHLCHQAGLRLVEVPIIFPDRVRGQSKMTWRIFVEGWLVVIRLRLDAQLARPRWHRHRRPHGPHVRQMMGPRSTTPGSTSGPN
jgi:dolichol-phosphate mannosyltransferase